MTNTAETEYAELIDTLDNNYRCGCFSEGSESMTCMTCRASAAISSLLAENARLKKTLEGIARQRLSDEMPKEDDDNADYTGGYEECVRRARAALHGDPQ